MIESFVLIKIEFLNKRFSIRFALRITQRTAILLPLMSRARDNFNHAC